MAQSSSRLTSHLNQDRKEAQSGEHNPQPVSLEAFKQWSQANQNAEYDEVLARPVFAAGQWVAPGVYLRVGSDILVRLHTADILPASLDGKVAHYILTTPVAEDAR